MLEKKYVPLHLNNEIYRRIEYEKDEIMVTAQPFDAAWFWVVVKPVKMGSGCRLGGCWSGAVWSFGWWTAQ